MDWLTLSLLSALLSGLVPSINKKILHGMHALEFSALFAVVNFALVLPLFFFVGLSIPAKVVFILYVGSLFSTAGFLTITKALRHLDVSYVSPMTNLSPVFLAVLAFAFLKETLSAMQLGGVALILAGAYVVEAGSSSATSFFEPLRGLVRNRHSFFILLSAMFYAVSSLVDKVVISSISVWQYTLLAHLFIAANFVVVSLVHRTTHPHHEIKRSEQRFEHLLLLTLLSAIVTVGYRVVQIAAVALGPVTLVVTIKHLSSLISTMVGGEFFHEKHLMQKSVACAIMVLGTLLIILS